MAFLKAINNNQTGAIAMAFSETVNYIIALRTHSKGLPNHMEQSILATFGPQDPQCPKVSMPSAEAFVNLHYSGTMIVIRTVSTMSARPTIRASDWP